jgi:hypothetical protein
MGSGVNAVYSPGVHIVHPQQKEKESTKEKVVSLIRVGKMRRACCR